MNAKKNRLTPILVVILLLLIAVLAFMSVCLLVHSYVRSHIITELVLEVGDALPYPNQFWTGSEPSQLAFGSDVSAIDTSVTGQHPITILYKDRAFYSAISVCDTTPPEGSVQNLTVWDQKAPAPSDFVVYMADATGVHASYRNEPNMDVAGDQTVTILLTDASNNTTTLRATLTIINDEQPPIITGVRDREVYEGSTISYRKGINITDNYDDAPTLTIDSSNVDLDTPGEYVVTYTATDIAGNSTSASAKVKVKQMQKGYVDEATIFEAVDKQLAEIITEEMTDREQVEAIYWWIRHNTKYINTSVKEDWMQSGYQMLQTRRGDCFSYFALCKLMLEHLEIPNIDVVKVPLELTDSMHYWSLVSVDDGENYYHVDITPRMDTSHMLLVTDNVLDAYSVANDNCYNRRKSDYPATPEEPLP